jgi:hypothetical protein
LRDDFEVVLHATKRPNGALLGIEQGLVVTVVRVLELLRSHTESRVKGVVTEKHGLGELVECKLNSLIINCV